MTITDLQKQSAAAVATWGSYNMTINYIKTTDANWHYQLSYGSAKELVELKQLENRILETHLDKVIAQYLGFQPTWKIEANSWG